MKKALLLLAVLAAVMMLTAAAAQESMLTQDEGLLETAPIAGKVERSDSAEHQTSFSLEYQFPQFEAVTAADQQINRYYQALAADLQQTAVTFEDTAEILCEVTHNSARYVSVLQTMSTMGGNGAKEILSADTFARDGLYAGQPLTLSQILGLETEDELSASFSIADKLVYDLIWQLVEREMQNPDGDYPEGLIPENLEGVFLPETDFYLDADGNIVFFIQAGELAGEVAGVLRFPFAPAELLSAI